MASHAGRICPVTDLSARKSESETVQVVERRSIMTDRRKSCNRFCQSSCL